MSINATYLGLSGAPPILNRKGKTLSRGGYCGRIHVAPDLPHATDLKIAMNVPKLYHSRPPLGCFERLFGRTAILQLSIEGEVKFVKLNAESLRKRLGIASSLFKKTLNSSRNKDLTSFVRSRLAKVTDLSLRDKYKESRTPKEPLGIPPKEVPHFSLGSLPPQKSPDEIKQAATEDEQGVKCVFDMQIEAAELKKKHQLEALENKISSEKKAHDLEKMMALASAKTRNEQQVITEEFAKKALALASRHEPERANILKAYNDAYSAAQQWYRQKSAEVKQRVETLIAKKEDNLHRMQELRNSISQAPSTL